MILVGILMSLFSGYKVSKLASQFEHGKASVPLKLSQKIQNTSNSMPNDGNLFFTY